MNKHTPGPWCVLNDKNIKSESVDLCLPLAECHKTAQWDAVQKTWVETHQKEANAQLISTAPTLLAIAQRYEAHEESAGGVTTEEYLKTHRVLRKDLRTAIERATAEKS